MTYRPIPGVHVLGISGAARHGKDTLALALMWLVPGAERFAFSDAISAVARACEGMSARAPKTLQEVGLRYRQTDPEVWLRCLYGAIDDRRPTLAVVTGVRFPEEAAMIRAMGGEVIRVVRLEADGRPYIAPDRDPRHETDRHAASLAVSREFIAASGDLATIHHYANELRKELRQCLPG